MIERHPEKVLFLCLSFEGQQKTKISTSLKPFISKGSSKMWLTSPKGAISGSASTAGYTGRSGSCSGSL
jgi:hypothetical protein